MKVKDKLIIMKKKSISTSKAQSILEYLIVLTAIMVVIMAHTFSHLGIGPGRVRALGVASALDQIHAEIDETIHEDYSGTAADLETQENEWYEENPIPEE